MNRIVVVGAGIAGTSAAYHLTEQTDAEVLVVDRGDIGSETTARSTAVFRQMGDPVLDPMKRYALETYNEFLGDPRTDVEFHLIGRLEAATADGSDIEATESVRSLDPNELGSAVVFPELDTDAITGAVYQPNAGIFDPVALAEEFAARARERGAAFRTGAAVTDVSVERKRVTGVELGDETVEASHVVAAAGPWNRELAAMAGADLPQRHTLAPILRLEPDEAFTHTLPNLKLDSGNYLLGQPDGTVLVGHSPGGYADAGTEYDPDEVSDTVPDGLRAEMLEAVGTVVPALADAEVIEEWVGVRSLTPDGLPVVGELREGLSVMAFNSEGIQLAPAAGRVVTAEVAGREDEFAGDVSPSRFA
jgi:sarcosine oxidase subunit beta